MNIDHKIDRDDRSAAAISPARGRYEAPNLTVLGDVRDLTLGGSPGDTESGMSGFTHKPTGT